MRYVNEKYERKDNRNMASLNKVTLIGFLGKDPEIRTTANGSMSAGFSLATTERWNDQYGNKQERTEWHNVTFWGKSAEFVQKYVHRGSQVFVEGSIRTNESVGKDGIKRFYTNIVGREIQLLDRQNNQGQQGGQYQNNQNGEYQNQGNGYQGQQNNGYQQNQGGYQQKPQGPSGYQGDDDIPF